MRRSIDRVAGKRATGKHTLMLFAIRPAFLVIPSFTFFAVAFPVQAANVAPTISGTPPSSVVVGFRYRFVPAARDANGDRLRFAIANKPAWASFDSATGRLTGAPAATGWYSNIVIKVSDGRISRSLPAFSIQVRRNHPHDRRHAAHSVVAGSAYFFKPTAADGDRQTLRFSIIGQACLGIVFNGDRQTLWHARKQGGRHLLAHSYHRN